MADFNKLKDTIRGAIYPNGRGAISADKHQAALLDMADTMQETAAQVTELSAEVSTLSIPFLGVAWQPIYHPLLKGQTIVSMANTNGISLTYGAGIEDELVLASQLPYTMAKDATGFYCISNDTGNLIVQGAIPMKLDELDNRLTDGLEGIATDVDGKISALTDSQEIPFTSIAWNDFRLPAPLKAGVTISFKANVKIEGVYLRPADGGEMIWVSKEMIPYTLPKEITAFQTIVDAQGSLVAQGIIDGKLVAIEAKVEEVENSTKASVDNVGERLTRQLFEEGNIGDKGEETDNAALARTNYIPCKKGDVIKGDIYRVKCFDADFVFLSEEMPNGGGNAGMIEHIVTTEDCSFVRIISLSYGLGSISINGVDIAYLIDKAQWLEQKKVEEKIEQFDGREISFTSIAWNGVFVNPTLKAGQIIHSIEADVEIVGIYLQRANGGEAIWVTKDMFPYTLTEEINAFQTIVDAQGVLKVQGVIDSKIEDALKDYKPSSGGSAARLSELPYIAIPVPELAVINIVANHLPTTKVDDIQAVLEFDDRRGNYFKKNIIINAQGSSSMGMAKKNFSVDIMDEAYDDSHKIKFGKWVAQDGFHLKSYMWDGLRVKAMAAYDIYESIILHNRPTRSNRVWKRAQLPTDIPQTGNDLNGTYLQLDSGAKGHPSGFPVIVNFNGEFYGIYCWQLKKHRDNYHQKKDNADHIHLDGVISDDLLWKVNGNIDWDKWAGKKAESEAIQSFEGTEIRNPKKLILVDGSEYDGDNNRGELISTASANYNPSNKDMVRTAEVRANIESLSRRVYALTQMSKGAAKKAEIAKVFDVDSIIDYIIFSQLLYNDDGYRKNWQWTTHDGVKWAVNAYDLDGVWGWSSWSYINPSQYWLYTTTPPIGLVVENYLEEIQTRYAELRKAGVVSVDRMMQPLVNYVQVIGTDYYDQEYEKWTEGVRDNLWRFEVWMEESIRLTDILMGYNGI